jgi:hypothetical protein
MRLANFFPNEPVPPVISTDFPFNNVDLVRFMTPV